MPGSGKEEFVKAATMEGLAVVRMGDVVRAFVSEQGLELTDANIGITASRQRELHGLGIWARRTLPMISGDRVVIDGIRGDAELSEFRASFGKDMVVVGVHTSPAKRFERTKKRRRADAPITLEDFRRRDERELGWGIGNALALCDHMIINEGTLEDFYKEIRAFLSEI